MADLPNYDAWLEEPYANQFSVDDFPAYEKYLEEWRQEQQEGYEDYLADLEHDGLPPVSFDMFLKECGLKPQDVEDFIDEMNEAAYEESLRLKGYDF